MSDENNLVIFSASKAHNLTARLAVNRRARTINRCAARKTPRHSQPMRRHRRRVVADAPGYYHASSTKVHIKNARARVQVEDGSRVREDEGTKRRRTGRT